MAGLIMIKTPDEVSAEITQRETPQEPVTPNLPALVSHFLSEWDTAKRRKIHVETEMIKAKHARAGEYTAEEMAAINKIGGTDAYRNICDVKCRTGAAWLRDLIFQPGDDPFDVEATQIPDLPPDTVERIKERVRSTAIDGAIQAEMQSGQPVDINQLKATIEAAAQEAMSQVGGVLYDEARTKAEGMKNVIKDQLSECKWEIPVARYIDDLVTYQAGILKGPVIRMRRELKWENIQGQMRPVESEVPAPYVDRVHPLDFYPVNPYDIEYSAVFERHQWHPGKLQQLIGVDGWREDEIRQVLADYHGGGIGDWLWTDVERNSANKLAESPGAIDCLEVWDCVKGALLHEYNISVDDMEKSYQIHAFLIGRRLVRLVLNPNPLGRRPYNPSSYVKGDTVWGRGVYSLIKDSIKAAGSVYRAAINNCAMAWGPLTEIDKNRLAPGDDGSIYPMKRFFTTDDQIVGQPAVRFTDIPYKGDAMFRALVEIEKRADDESGIPAYAHGSSDISGAGKTSSGLHTLLNMATKTIKDVVRNIDDAIEGLIEGMYYYNMEYHPDMSIKGDCNIVARGSSALVIKEQMSIRLREFLAQTANQIDMQITGVEGRAYALKEAAKGLNLDADKIVPMMPQRENIPEAQPQQQKPQTLDAAGNPVSGQDNIMPEAQRAVG